MINIKKGPGLSLHQVDKIGVDVDGDIDKGHVVRFDENAGVIEVKLGASADPTPANELFGFAINASTDGDVLESGKLGAVLLDGSTVVETDKTQATITYANYPLGEKLTAHTNGNVKVADSDDKVIGLVEGIRELPSVETVGSTKIQSTRALLAIKVAV